MEFPENFPNGKSTAQKSSVDFIKLHYLVIMIPNKKYG